MFFKPRLKKFQFSLRAFLATSILLGVYLGIAIPQAQQQKKVTDWVRSYGRTPYYSYQFDPTDRTSQSCVARISRHFIHTGEKPFAAQER